LVSEQPIDPAPAQVMVPFPVCNVVDDALVGADAALAAGALDDARVMLRDLARCPGADLALIDRRLRGTEVLISARHARLTGATGQEVLLLAAQRAVDPDLPGLEDALFTALLESGQDALSSGQRAEARAYCGEALAMRPTDDAATWCVLAAAPPTSTPEPTPSPEPTVRPTPSAAPSTTPIPSPVATATPVPATGVPTTPSNAPATSEPTLGASCAVPRATFAAPTVALGATTMLIVSGLAPDTLFSLMVTSAPEGYTTPVRELRTDAACRRSIPLVFRPEEHPPGQWTFTVRGSQPTGDPVTLSAGIRVTP
jgi:hypothetical protein